MAEIDIEAAKQDISPLLERAAHGEQVTILDQGRAVARVMPPEFVRPPEQQQRIRDAMEAVKALRAKVEPGDYSWEEMKKLRDFGRPGCE